MITRTIFESHLNCKYKAYLQKNPGAGKAETNEYADLMHGIEEEYRVETCQSLFPNGKILHHRIDEFSTDRLIKLYQELNPQLKIKVG